MALGVLAWLIEAAGMTMMLDHPHPEAAALQSRDQLLQEGGLAHAGLTYQRDNRRGHEVNLSRRSTMSASTAKVSSTACGVVMSTPASLSASSG